MKSSLLTSSFAALLLIGPAFALAQPPEGSKEEPRSSRRIEREVRRAQPDVGQRTERVRPDLGLTDTQKADLRKAREDARRDRLRKSTDLRIARMDLKSLLRNEKVDEKAVAASLAEVQAAQGALLKLKVDSALALKRILTPEQQKMLMDHRGQGRGMMNRRNRMKHGDRGMRSRGDRRNDGR